MSVCRQHRVLVAFQLARVVQDYDDWGVPGWTAKDVLPWFKRAEDNPAMGNSEWHSTGVQCQSAVDAACL